MAQRPQHVAHAMRRVRAIVLPAALLMVGATATSGATAQTPSSPPCATGASTACYFTLELGSTPGQFHYYASRTPGVASAAGGPRSALVAIHGHPRDGNKTFDAALKTIENAGASADTLIVAPVFQVATTRAAKCQTAGVPTAVSGDLLWTCSSWLQGDQATNGSTTSFAALDGLLRELVLRWPSLRTITVAGFSAGAQVVQHYIGFAARPPAGVALRYVVADPGTWLYFDAERAQPRRQGSPVDWSDCGSGNDLLANCTLAMAPPPADCEEANRWKYGTENLPAALGRSAAEARAVYAAADISYLEAERDMNADRGNAYRVLDRSCGAMAQGPFRLQRGLAYAAYDRALLAPAKQRTVTVVPGCGHDVACVFPSASARAALIGPAH
jgi:hypothetical protein